MKKIMLIPLDERPCTYDFVPLMAKGTDLTIISPPKELMGKKKQKGDIEKLFAWALENAKSCDGAIISMDTLIYSGILPSRLHNDSVDELLARAEKIRELKRINPALVVYAFTLIMRNPKYSSGDEEPDYYAECGREIHRYGYINHRLEQKIATAEEIAELDEIKKTLPMEHYEDYVSRRLKNIEVNRRIIDLTGDGAIDFLIVPQDDSAPYGLTAKDQQIVREHIRETRQQLRVYMYPDADAVANTLLARMANHFAKKRPLVYVKYASASGDTIIPLYEDRTVSETIKYHILAAGGLVASSASEADLILMVNTPSANHSEHQMELTELLTMPKTLEYDANRNLIEQVEYAEYAINTLDKAVVFADNAYANGGDPALFELIRNKGIMFKLAGYAGWNTSSNTIGTCIPQGMLFLLYGDRQEHRDFLALRYVEDIGYMCSVRKEVTIEELEKRGLTYFLLDGERGEVSRLIWDKLQSLTDEYISDGLHSITITDCYQPWNRMFEVGLSVICADK